MLIKKWFSLIRSELKNLKKQFATRFDNHAYHIFKRDFTQRKPQILAQFEQGLHLFEPMIAYNYYGKIEPMWGFLDKLLIKILYQHIKPTFKHIISSCCYHLKGPSSIKTITHRISNALSVNDYRYVIRADIKSYYASIDRDILCEQLAAEFDDPAVLSYLLAIVHNVIDRGGWIETPDKGIPRKSSLSSFFAALYLKPLDLLFEEQSDVLYVRYNDDILILCQTRRQFVKAKKKLSRVLKQLRLKLSPTKTRMGKLHQGFHFLGIDYQVAQTSEPTQCHSAKVSVKLHQRCYHRAIDQLKEKREDAGHPAKAQSYLIRWSRWWSNIHQQIQFSESLLNWTVLATRLFGEWTSRFGFAILCRVWA